MKNFMNSLRRRMLRGIDLTEAEHASIDAVIKRMRTAIRKNRGIRLSRDELRVLGLYGLKQQFEVEENNDSSGD